MTPLAQQPQFIAATNEINRLNTALAKVQSRITEIESMLQGPLDSSPDSHVEAALEFAETGVVRGPSNTPVALHEEHVVLRQQRDSVQQAIAGLRAAQSKLTQELSATVCREREQAHKDLARRYLSKLLELDAMRQEEVDFIGDIESNGYDARFRDYVAWPAIGSLWQRSESAIWYRVRELQAYVG
jgi:phosphoenolpyruvate-protein kinase (PTS system EI component)